MNLKYTTRTVHVVDYTDFDAYVQAFFGMKDYEFVSNEKASNYSCYDYAVTGEDLDDYEKKRMREWLNGETYVAPAPMTLLNAMAAEGSIPTGEYLIKVFW